MLITIRLMKLNWETLTIANKHHNIELSAEAARQQKTRKFLPTIFFCSSRLKKLLDAMENHFAMSTSREERKKSFSFISFWLLTIYLLSIFLVNLKLRFHFSFWKFHAHNVQREDETEKHHPQKHFPPSFFFLTKILSSDLCKYKLREWMCNTNVHEFIFHPSGCE